MLTASQITSIFFGDKKKKLNMTKRNIKMTLTKDKHGYIIYRNISN